MVSIQIGGEDKSAEIIHWSIWSDRHEGLQLQCSYLNKGKAVHALDDCVISPTRELGESLLTKLGSSIITPIARATIYGERYAVVHYPDADTPYVFKMDRIGFAAPTAMKEAPVFDYFTAVANARQERAESKNDRDIAANWSANWKSCPPVPTPLCKPTARGATARRHRARV